jgi:prepilin-type processing-associated H-X9-DG protein
MRGTIKMRKHALKTLGLSLLAALGLMAVVAGSAQAAGEVKVAGSTSLATGATFSGVQEGLGTLLVPAINFRIVCHSGKVLSATVLSGPLGTALGTVKFEECLAQDESGNPLNDCVIEEGKTITAKGSLQVLLHNNDSYILATGDLGPENEFAVVKIEQPSLCPIGTLTMRVKGTLGFKVLAGDLTLGGAEVEKILIDTSQAIQSLLGDTVKFGANTAFLDGSAEVSLTGAHVGMKWGML